MVDTQGVAASILPTPEEEEVWKDIPNLPNYEASSFGRIRNKLTGWVRSEVFDKDGYLTLTIMVEKKRKLFKVHRLICETFWGAPPEGKNICDHRDRCRINNYYKNLRWVDVKTSNANKAIDHSREHITRNTTPICLMDNQTHTLIKRFDNVIQACRELHLSEEQVKRHLRNRRRAFSIGYFITEQAYLKSLTP